MIEYYKGFKIFKEKYIEERHPQYSYLAFTAKKGRYYYQAVFSDLDMRLKSDKELFSVFLNGFDEYYIAHKELFSESCIPVVYPIDI